MKGQKPPVWVILTLVAALFVAPGSVAAEATWVECAGTEILLETMNPGTWTFPGGNIRVKGMVSLYQEESTCPQVAGINTVTMNAFWDGNAVGPMWGTARLVTDDGGVWESTWLGRTYTDGSFSYQAVGHGVSGSVAGLHMMLVATPSGWTASILDPGAG